MHLRFGYCEQTAGMTNMLRHITALFRAGTISEHFLQLKLVCIINCSMG